MKNMLSYFRKHKNHTFETLPFNDIDSLILSQISYLNIENVIKNYTKINDLITQENSKVLCDKTMTYMGNKKLCKIFSDNKRYSEIFIVDYQDIKSDDNNTQFFAVTYYCNDFLYIAFRGTDLTIFGWREDFDMLYSLTPSQKCAVDYINYIVEKYHKQVIIGGHSKGGNLALYGSMYSSLNVKKYIKRIYNFDGPGFYDKTIYNTKEFESVRPRLISVTSRVSMVAMLLYNVPGVRFIKVKNVSVLTHDAFNWGVNLNSLTFDFVKNNSFSSKVLDEAATTYMEESTPSDRKKVVEILFKIVKESPTMSLIDVVHHPINFIKRSKVRHIALSKDENNYLSEEIKKIRIILKKSLKNSIIGHNGEEYSHNENKSYNNSNSLNLKEGVKHE